MCYPGELVRYLRYPPPWLMQVAMERQMLSEGAFLEPAQPSDSCLPIFSDVYNQRYVCLTKPPAGMSTMPVSSCIPRKHTI